MNDEYGYWLSGLIDGEGCFRIHRFSDSTRPQLAPTFSLKLRDDDSPLLHEIVARTGLGKVKPDKVRSGKSNPCAVWIVTTKADCRALVALLDRYPLRSRKLRDYLVWREAVAVHASLKRGNRWHGPTDWSPLRELAARLTEAREYA